MGDASISRHLSAEFVQNWQRAYPEGQVIRRDLTTSDLPLLTADWIGASRTPAESQTPAQREALAYSDTLIAELEAADEYILGVPMHNFTLASAFRLWIDQIARANKTFSYASGTPVGLLTGKTATFLIASGADYGPGSAMASYNFVEPYLRTMFGFLGVTDTHFHAAGGVQALAYGKVDRDTFFKPHLEAIRARFQTA